MTLDDVQKSLAEESLYDFIRIFWPFIDKSEFVPNWHIELICKKLEDVIYGRTRFAMFNIPPRHMKSTGAAVCLAPWTWMQQGKPGCWAGPSTQFLYASYAQQLSVRDSIKARRLMNTSRYQKFWRNRFRLRHDQNAKIRFDNDHFGYRIATSVSALATGEGGDIIVIDDAHNVREAESDTVRQGTLDWWDESMSSRLNDPNRGAYIVIGQRVHQDDICGHILEREGTIAEGGLWDLVCLPARYEIDHPHRYAEDPRTADGELLWPARFNGPALDKIESTMGSYAVAGQMQQRPAPREGGMFKRAWFEGDDEQNISSHILDEDKLPAHIVWVRHWDLAATKRKATDKRGARTAGVKMGRSQDGRYFVAHCEAKNLEGNSVKELVKYWAEEDGIGVMVSINEDPGQAGKVQKNDYATLLDGYNVRFLREDTSKEKRAEPFAAQCEAGKVYLIRGGWNKEWLDEVCMFPGGRRKDIPDASSGAYQRLSPRHIDLDPPIAGPRVFSSGKLLPGLEAEVT